MKTNRSFHYHGKNTNEISFPLGGIGTGCIGLGGNGRLMDFEIFNRPNKQSYNGFTFLAVKAEDENGTLDTRVLCGDMHAPYTGSIPGFKNHGFGFGVNMSTLSGMPHFKDFEFLGAFPIASIAFEDEAFPGLVHLTAYNPFIPLNDKDSSLPCAFFEIEFTNPTDRPLAYTTAFTLSNPAKGGNLHKVHHDHVSTCICLDNDLHATNHPEYGGLCIATDNTQAAVQRYWYRGPWFDGLSTFWRDFSAKGKLKDRCFDEHIGKSDTATITGSIPLQPHETGKIKFVLSWYYPNCYNYWKPETDELGQNCAPTIWRNYYATIFQDARECTTYCFKHYQRLREQTLMFKDALFSSTLPDCVLDAVSANLSILKSPTCLRLEDGSFYGFEGCAPSAGSCEGSCTHVWNYAYALPFLFPSLERSMRALDFQYNMDEHGGMRFRLPLPLGRQPAVYSRPCADGQFGGVIKTYREWKISGDDAWLKAMWPSLKKSIAFAWTPYNQDQWDIHKTGVLHGRQHHTLDMELFGPNSWLSGFYLAALKAASEIAFYLKDDEAGMEYSALFDKGKAWVFENLFNGLFYYHKIDLKDKSIVDAFDAADRYWNDEAQEIKYQIGEGSAIDQVLAQWHANICGLGEIFDTESVRTSLQTIYKHNYKRNMRGHVNPCRVYCINDERGTVICEWPDKAKKPAIPVPYSEETFHGNEYQVATHMLQMGMVDEGVELFKAVRDRYDGYCRNPYNEIEWGSNYARSMASYAALLAFSGFMFDMPDHKIGFDPIVKGDFQAFWCLDSGWGMFEKDDCHAVLHVQYGTLQVKKLDLRFIKPKTVTVDGKALAFTLEGSVIHLCSMILLCESQSIEVFGEAVQ